MPWYIWVLILDMVISAIVIIYRGATGYVRTYKWSDAVATAILVPLYIWGIVFAVTH